MEYSYYVRRYFCQICQFKASWGGSNLVKFTFFCDLTWPFCTKISLMPSLGLYRQISSFFFCISSFDAKTSMYAKNHENLGHSMCHPLPGFSLDGLLKRSVMKTQEMCPIRAEISIHKHLGKCIYFLFVWLAVIGFRQNYFYILPNFGDFGAKMSFFHYIINQKRNNFIKHCSPRVPRSREYQRCISI